MYNNLSSYTLYYNKMKKLFFQVLFVSLCFSCKSQLSPIKKALDSSNEKISIVTKNISNHDIQIKLSTINNKNQKKKFKDYNYHTNKKNYFYPASTVKLPITIFAIEKLNENHLINLDTRFKLENDSIITTIRKEINEILIMSSNESYNRLFEFLGQDYINRKLDEKGMKKSRIFHRLSTENSSDTKTRKIIFYTKDSLVIEYPIIENKKLKNLNLNNLLKGDGYIDINGNLISKPMNFSRKNYLPIDELHHLTKLIFFPEKFKNGYRLNLNKEQIEFIKQSMSSTPKDIGYDREEFYDSYSNLFIYGDTTEVNSNKIKIFNKIGFAYGHLTESAFIKSEENSFILSATIKVNNNRIYNDDKYEYDTVGFAFLAELGREILKIVESK